MTARRTAGWRTIQGSPAAAMETNQTQHDRPEDGADAAGAALLHENSTMRMTQVIGTTNGEKRVRRDLEPLDRGEHRDRRRDHAVAVEQRRAEEAQHDQQHLGPQPSRSCA